MNKNEFRMYNILLPLWLLLFWPSWLWLILIPANYLVDRLVLRWSLAGMENRGPFCRRHTWKICLAGFLSDFIGALILFAVFMICGSSMESVFGLSLEDLGYGVGFDPFSNVPAFLITALAVAASGLAIYLIDKVILRKAGLDIERAKASALRLALITAPYLYFFPSKLLYGTDWIVG